MKKAEKAVLGTWRITGMDVWDADYFDMEAPAHITIRSELRDERFGGATIVDDNYYDLDEADA